MKSGERFPRRIRALPPKTGARLCEPQPAPDSKAFPLVLSTIGLAKLLRVADPRSVRFMERGDRAIGTPNGLVAVSYGSKTEYADARNVGLEGTHPETGDVRLKN